MSAAPDEEVASPCIGVCQLQPGTRLCDGCLRTVAEITEWRSASPHRRREILAAAAERTRSAGRPPRPADPR